MRYFSIYVPNTETNPPRKQTAEQQQAMGEFVGKAMERGEFLQGGGFLPLKTHGCIVRRSHGASTIVDGPYTESKELVGGFAMLEFPTREAAIEGAKRFLEVAGDGECVTYAIMDGNDC
jgi:hypothetical protein